MEFVSWDYEIPNRYVPNHQSDIHHY
jgi:hypothetical protein